MLGLQQASFAGSDRKVSHVYLLGAGNTDLHWILQAARHMLGIQQASFAGRAGQSVPFLDGNTDLHWIL
jgi:hypothetical protein